MEVAYYEVTGEGPGDERFVDKDVRTDSVVRSSLLPGLWSVTVRAYNADDVEIGIGKTDVPVRAGAVARADVIVGPLPGSGGLSLVVRLPADVLADPVVTGSLTGPTETTLSFSPSPISPASSVAPGSPVDFSATVDGLPVGYYRANLELSDGGTVVWGTVVAVRIIADQISEDVFPLVEQTNRGGASLTLITDLQNPFEIQLSVAADSELIEGLPVEITATAPGAAVDQWQWYVQGTSLGDSVIDAGVETSTVVLPGRDPGTYHVSVLAREGEVLSSATLPVTLAEDASAVGRIAFADVGEAGTRDIFVINADGTGLVNLTPGGGNDKNAVWSPDGSKIAFASDLDPATGLAGADFEIFVMDADGSNLVQLTDNQGDDQEPTWSPDGSAIAFAGERGDEQLDIYTMNADGTNEVRLTVDSVAQDFTPSWSQNEIVFSSDRNAGNVDLWIMTDDGTNLRQVTSASSVDWYPDLSRDGTAIVYEEFSFTAGVSRQIVAVDADGGNRRVLTDEPGGSNLSPDWSPSGRYVVFYSDADGFPGIYRMNADGTARILVTTVTTRTGVDPSWIVLE
jgi:TolB protein